MTNARTPPSESPPRRRRARPVPRWLKDQQDLDEMAKRRCLMVLEVLSGMKPVSDAVEEAKISRGLYYQLETKAVRAMLNALSPGAESTGQPAGMVERVKQLEQKVTRLEREKRRLERVLYVTKQVVRPGPVAAASGRRSASTTNGKKPSPESTTKTPAPSASVSTPTTGGGGVRSSGSGN